jgi:hypothetical protein
MKILKEYFKKIIKESISKDESVKEKRKINKRRIVNQ